MQMFKIAATVKKKEKKRKKQNVRKERADQWLKRRQLNCNFKIAQSVFLAVSHHGRKKT